MKKLKRILLTKLHNVEIPILMEDVIEVLEKNDLKALHLQDMYNILMMYKPKAKTLAIPGGKHQYTPLLAELHGERLMYASLINSNVKALLNINDEEKKQMAVLARRQTLKYLTYLGREDRPFVSDSINRFFLYVNAGEVNQTREAFEALGLQHYINSLRKANRDYIDLFEKREESLEENSKKDNPIKRCDTLWALRLFFDKVRANQKIYKDTDYSQLIHDLNIHLTANSKRIKTRITINKRKAEKKAQAKQEAAAQKDNTTTKALKKPTQQAKAKAIPQKETPPVDKKKTEANLKTTPAKRETKGKTIKSKDLRKTLKRDERKKKGK